jgi:hypothetical protein
VPRRTLRHRRGAADLDDVTDTAPAHRGAEHAARQSYGKLVACLAARTGDVAAAEDALCDAVAAALASWPTRGVPQAPDAWLLAAARRRMIDMAPAAAHPRSGRRPVAAVGRGCGGGDEPRRCAGLASASDVRPRPSGDRCGDARCAWADKLEARSCNSRKRRGLLQIDQCQVD